MIVALLLAVAAVLAIGSLLGDSITFDETSHLSSGMSILLTGDFRIAPDHPPLARLWCAWPLLFSGQHWPGATSQWLKRDAFGPGREWLFESGNDGERLMMVGRLMMVLLLLATLLLTWRVARRLFGPPAGLLALALAALCPTMLAHGRLVTTDLPVTLCGLAGMLALARLLERLTLGRWLAAAGACGALSLVKFSWPIVAAALTVMVLSDALDRLWQRRTAAAARGRVEPDRGRIWPRLVAVAALLPAVWIMIWSAYLWRFSMFSDEAAAKTPSVDAALPADGGGPISPRASMEAEWERMLADQSPGSPIPRAAPWIRWARNCRLLPEAYLWGFTWVLRGSTARSSYFMGETSDQGFRAYFPTLLALKTPLATLAISVAGLAALALRRLPIRDTTLLIGIVSLGVLYLANSILSGINIGHRHLLPVYPAIYVAAGAAAAWGATRAGKWLLGGGLLWLAAANVWIYPHYLCYFNELIGGPRNAHLYVADSNIDWGQDLKRLAAYARQHPDEKLKLAYFGSADPTCYGFEVKSLVSYFAFEPRAPLTTGTYIISITQLLGVYEPEIRESFWRDPAIRDLYRRLAQLASQAPPPGESPEARQRRERALQDFGELRVRRLIAELRRRVPDERIGWSLWVYRLSEADVERLTRPEQESERS